jgi:hypothetical protein
MMFLAHSLGGLLLKEARIETLRKGAMIKSVHVGNCTHELNVGPR